MGKDIDADSLAEIGKLETATHRHLGRGALAISMAAPHSLEVRGEKAKEKTKKNT